MGILFPIIPLESHGNKNGDSSGMGIATREWEEMGIENPLYPPADLKPGIMMYVQSWCRAVHVVYD